MLLIEMILFAIGIHRLWLYEDIFERPRQMIIVATGGGFKPLTCPPCFAFWALFIAYLIYEPLLDLDITVVNAMVWGVTYYPVIRFVVWLQHNVPDVMPESAARKAKEDYMQRIKDLAHDQGNVIRGTRKEIEQSIKDNCPNCNKKK